MQLLFQKKTSMRTSSVNDEASFLKTDIIMSSRQAKH